MFHAVNGPCTAAPLIQLVIITDNFFIVVNPNMNTLPLGVIPFWKQWPLLFTKTKLSLLNQLWEQATPSGTVVKRPDHEAACIKDVWSVSLKGPCAPP